MGKETTSKVSFSGRTSEGKTYLETDEIVFRGDFRLKIPLKSIKQVGAKEGKMHVNFSEGTAVFELGEQAEKWVKAIKNPKSLIDKIGVKPDHRVTLLGINDAEFLEQLSERAEDIHDKLRDKNDIIFFAAENKDDLSRLSSLQKFIKRDGAIWVISPKGKQHIKDTDVITAGKQYGLVDVKVVRFSETHTALKLVIPLRKR